jgi:hypothetical protein
MKTVFTLIFCVAMSVQVMAQVDSPGAYLEKAADFKEIAVISRLGGLAIPAAIVLTQHFYPQPNADLVYGSAAAVGVLLLGSSIVYEFKAINSTRRAGKSLSGKVSPTGLAVSVRF